MPDNDENLGENTYDLFSCTPEQQDQLRLVIKAQQGSLRVFVHPFYDCASNPMCPTEKIAETIKSYQVTRRDLGSNARYLL